MVGSCEVVAQGFGAVLAHEDGTGVLHGVQIVEGIVNAELQMLGGDLVGDVDGLHQGVGHDDLTIVVDGCPGDGGTGQEGDLIFQLRLNGQCKVSVIGDQHGAGHLVMLCLTEKVRRHMAGIGGGVSDHQNFTGACDHVDGDFSEDLLLGFGHVGIAGAHDLVHLGDGLGAVGQSGHSLGAAHLEDAVHACDLGGGQDHGIDLAVGAGGRGDDDLLASCDLGGDGVHEDGGGVSGGAAGDVKAHPFDGGDLLAHDHAIPVDDEGISHLLFVEEADVGGGFPEDVQEFGLHGLEGFVDFGGGDFQRSQNRLVEPGGVLEEGFVAPGADVCDDGGDGGLDVGCDIVTGEDFLVGNLAVFVDLNHGFPPALSGKIGYFQWRPA